MALAKTIEWIEALLFKAIRSNGGDPLPPRTNINFIGPTITDDEANDQTTIDFTTGGDNAAFIRGKTVSTTAPDHDHDFLGWNGSTLQWEPSALAGDVIDAAKDNRVQQAHGVVQGGTASDVFSVFARSYLTEGLRLPYFSFSGSGALNDERAIASATSSSASIVLPTASGSSRTAGDIYLVHNGSSGAQTLSGSDVNIDGSPTQATAAGTSTFVWFNGTQWERFIADAGALWGRAVSSGNPGDGQVLTWSNSSASWVFTTPSSGFAAGGDLGGTSTSQTVLGATGSGGIFAIHANDILFDASVFIPFIGQSIATSGDGSDMEIRAQYGQASGNTNGGGVWISSGSGHGTGSNGYVALALAEVNQVVLKDLAGRAAVSFFNSTFSSTNLPTGSGVLFLGTAATAPSSNPVGGVAIWESEANSTSTVTARGVGGAVTQFVRAVRTVSSSTTLVAGDRTYVTAGGQTFTLPAVANSPIGSRCYVKDRDGTFSASPTTIQTGSSDTIEKPDGSGVATSITLSSNFDGVELERSSTTTWSIV